MSTVLAILHKGDFRDVVCLCYTIGHCLIFQVIVFVVLHLPLTMPLPAPMLVIQFFATMRSRTSCTAWLRSKVRPNVATEPTLHTVTNECFFHRSANTESGAHLDVRARRFGVLIISRLILMSMCSILWLQLIISPLFPPVLDLMIVRSVEYMNNKCILSPWWNE